jgi:2-polyprenyl-6-methoxyphenol hydroxylase-like FAD-dependent oxidoreductase
MKVAIVGGGIGGMALALSLHDAGIADVDIYESAPAVKELGVGINVLPHAVRELTELGLLDDLLKSGDPHRGAGVLLEAWAAHLGRDARSSRRLSMAASGHPPR